jgi:putative glutamine amidotransferase
VARSVSGEPPPTRVRRGILPDMPAETSAAASPLIVVAVADPQLNKNPELAARKNELYAAGIRRHGGTPALLHSSVPATERKRLLGAMAGLLLSGGADLEPALYGESPQGAAGMDPLRDELELEAWYEAGRRAVPVLGICRGLQAINVFSGGSLLQDVPSHTGTSYGHGPAQMHRIEVDRATVLGRTLGGDPGADPSADLGRGATVEVDAAPTEAGVAPTKADAAPTEVEAAPDGPLALTVNTFHHQAVREDQLAPGLRPAAWADSEFGRLIEGFEGTGDRWLVAVQCHPERLDSTPADFERLWASFVDAAREFAAAPVENAARPA